MNKIILSLGGIAQLNGICSADVTDEQLAVFLAGIAYVDGRSKISVAEVRLRQQQVEVEQLAREKESQGLEARRYLASTDWYIIRQQETGKAVPVEILAERQQARDSI